MQRKLAAALLLTTGLVARPSGAQTLEWVELPTADRGCAASISVGANSIPWITGCNSTPDKDVFYLNVQSCSPQPCFGTSESWQIATLGQKASSVNVGRDGVPWLLDSAGRIYAGSSNQFPDTYNQITAWTSLPPNPAMCMSSIAVAENTGFFVDGVTTGTGIYPTIYGLGCSITGGDQYGDHPIYQWNIDLSGAFFGNPIYTPSPGWEELGPANYGAKQIVLFNEAGPSNPQASWIRDGAGGLWQWDGGNWNFGNGANQLLIGGYTVVWLTDHYLEAYLWGPSWDSAIYQWSDQTQSWSYYASGLTAQNTVIKQIASSQAMQTNGSATIGPSAVYGIDSNGHIFSLVPTPSQD